MAEDSMLVASPYASLSLDAHRILRFERRGHGELWQGGISSVYTCLAGAPDARHFHDLVLMANEHQIPRSSFPPGLRVHHHPIDDTESPTAAEMANVLVAARSVADAVASGRAALVTCHMGWNRSGLVVASAAMLLTSLSPSEIVARIRIKRGPRALSNRKFEKILKHPAYRAALAGKRVA